MAGRAYRFSHKVVLAGVLPFLALLGVLTAPQGGPASAAVASGVVILVQPTHLGTISPYLFGSNLLWQYDSAGAFDPSHDQFYPSFLQAAFSTGTTALRYPAGISADSFNWEDAIGPQATRQPNEPYGMQAGSLSNGCCTLTDSAPSTVGPDEYGQLLDATGALGDVVVNFATGTAQEAGDFAAYMTAGEGIFPSSDPLQPSYWAALRSADGHSAPYNVAYWEVGNEQDVPGQYGWRSGALVNMGPHSSACSSATVAACLYAFGGTTSFTKQAVGTFAEQVPQASYSDGQPGQDFYAYFPPVVTGSQVVYVDGQAWSPVASLAGAGPDQDVYAFDPSTGEIYFGDGVNGAVPPAGSKVTISYQSGPHDGFVQFYSAIKQADPSAQVCESEEGNLNFLKVMGSTYPYDCVVFHPYAQPSDTTAPLPQYEEDLMGRAGTEGASVAALEQQVAQYSGRHVPVVLTEYGQLISPQPLADASFNLSLYEALFAAAQVEQWAADDVPLADKYLLNSTPFLSPTSGALPDGIELQGMSALNSMIAGPGPSFVVEPVGQALDIMSRLAGSQLMASAVQAGPTMQPYPGEAVPALQVMAAASGGDIQLAVINGDPSGPVTASVDLSAVSHEQYGTVTVLDGPAATSYNTPGQPDQVSSTVAVHKFTAPQFEWTFPAHSLTFFQWGGSSFSPGPTP